MVSTWSELEPSGSDRLSRDQLRAAIRARADDLPGDLQERREEQSTGCPQQFLNGHDGDGVTVRHRHSPSTSPAVGSDTALSGINPRERARPLPGTTGWTKLYC
jgi:hypothetical protein